MTLGIKIQNSKLKIQIHNLKFKTYLIFILASLFFCSGFAFAFSRTPTSTPEATSSLPSLEGPFSEGPPDAFSFVVFGDNRDGDKIFMDLIEKVNQEKDLSFAVNTGDLVSYGREGEYKNYLRMISKLKIKVYNVPGNHDLVLGGTKRFQEYFGPLYYAFDYKNSHFIILNNALRDSFDAKQFEWLREDLANSKKKNIFVFMHRPTFDPSELYKNHIMSGRETIAELMEVFRKYKVNYVIAGHIHGYARAKRDGTVYIVTGGAGAPLYLPKDFGGFYHYAKIEVDGNKIVDEVVRVYE